jgi:hypothetical protein
MKKQPSSYAHVMTGDTSDVERQYSDRVQLKAQDMLGHINRRLSDLLVCFLFVFHSFIPFTNNFLRYYFKNDEDDDDVEWVEWMSSGQRMMMSGQRMSNKAPGHVKHHVSGCWYVFLFDFFSITN